MIIAGHQPDLLPYSGFWYKVAKADVFDVKIYDQFVDRGYQRRVKMREKWANIPAIQPPYRQSIYDVKLRPDANTELVNAIIGRYRGSRFWQERHASVLNLIEQIHTDRLWVFNFELIIGIRDLLGITTPISIAVPTVGGGAEGLVSVLQRYPGDITYLSGTGAKVYMGDCAEFTAAGITVEWSKHHAVTGDSILSVLFDYADPLAIVLMEEDDVQQHQHDSGSLQGLGAGR